MKSNKQISTSRRAFLKTAATMGTAAAIGSSSIRNATAARSEQTRKKKPRENNESKKIGPIEDQPQQSVFRKLERRRMPGWRGDTLGRFLTGDETFYPEQLLRVENGHYDPFGHVNPNANILKPPPPDPPQDPEELRKWQQQWLEFNTWVLGAPRKTEKRTTFDDFLDEIGNRVRRYNAALYWMRRLHFHENDIPISKPPDYNENGDDEKDLPDLSTTDGKEKFEALAKKAVARWEKAVKDLNQILAGEGEWERREFEDTNADMIEVNGYIVSMRVISKPENRELGGSSSSHISISSAFSSPK